MTMGHDLNKQTQFSKHSEEYKYFYEKPLWKKSTCGRPAKQTQSQKCQNERKSR